MFQTCRLGSNPTMTSPGRASTAAESRSAEFRSPRRRPSHRLKRRRLRPPRLSRENASGPKRHFRKFRRRRSFTKITTGPETRVSRRRRRRRRRVETDSPPLETTSSRTDRRSSKVATKWSTRCRSSPTLGTGWTRCQCYKTFFLRC